MRKRGYILTLDSVVMATFSFGDRYLVIITWMIEVMIIRT